MTTLQISEIRREPELQCRAKGINKNTVAEYAEAMKVGASFPPVVVFRDGKGAHWLADGFHRVAAAELAELPEIPVDVREGSRKDALLHAAGANISHGLRRTLADRREAILRVASKLFGNEGDASYRKIAKACGVDHKTVKAVLEREKKRLATEPAAEGGEFPTPPVDVVAPETDLGAAYLEVAAAHTTRSADDHRHAFEGALALAFAPGPQRRRVVQPKGDAIAAANGGE